MAEKKKMQQLLLPNDIIVEILSWLPAKSLLRFRWTCKYWFDLITNNDVHDDFIKMHLYHSTTTISPYSVLSFYFMDRNAHPNRLEIYQGYHLNYNDTNGDDVSRSSEVNRIDHPSVFPAFPSVKEYIHAILGSSNGLMLLMLSSPNWWCEFNLCILNPCTKEYKILRHPLVRFYQGGETYGFGYDQTMDDYKLVKILHTEVEVYTLGRDSWRRIGPNPYKLSSSAGVFLNGALYWMDFMHENIISFDIGMEKFQLVAKTSPDLIGNNDELHKLQVFEGSLCLVIKKTTHRRNSPVKIWVMKDHTMNNSNNESSLLWTKLLTIPDIRHFPIKPVRYTRNGKILMLNNLKDLVLYDPKNTSDPITLSRMIRENRCRFLVLEVYTESLVSLNSRTYTGQQQRKECAQ